MGENKLAGRLKNIKRGLLSWQKSTTSTVSFMVPKMCLRTTLRDYEQIIRKTHRNQLLKISL